MGTPPNGKKTLLESHPEIAFEADGWDPSSVTKGHDQKKRWKCHSGHTWEAAPYTRTGKLKRGCPVCAGKAVAKGFNDLLTTHPAIAEEAHGWDATQYSHGSKKSKQWKCPNGHIYESSIQSRTLAGTGCPVCAGKKTVSGFNDLLSNFPKIAEEADGWDASAISKGSRKKVKWKCQEGHSWEASISDRTGKHKSGCPICSNHQLLGGENDLLTKFPDIALEADGWDPTLQVSGGKKKLKWKCKQGHTYISTVYSRTSNRKQGCPYCANFKVLAGFNDMATTHPDLAKELHGSDPTKLIAGSAKKVEWQCKLGHIYLASPDSRSSSRNSGCPICDGKQVLFGFNDLQTKYPNLAAEADGWDPKTVTAGSSIKRSWRCAEGHVWKTTPNSRVGQGAGCPSCAIYGFDPNKEGYFYFLSHEEWELLQIGITNYPKDRMKKHKKLGWSVIEIRGPMDGGLTRDWETESLRFLKKRGVELGPRTAGGKFDGYSETWRKSDFPVGSIAQLFDFVRDAE